MAGSRKSALGRGFEDLFSNTEIVEKEVNIKPEHEGSGKDIVYIDINEIKPNRTQPRKFFDAEKIKEFWEYRPACCHPRRLDRAHRFSLPHFLLDGYCTMEHIQGLEVLSAGKNYGL